MISLILVIGLLIFGIKVIAGEASITEKALKFLALMIFGPVLVMVAANHLEWMFIQLPWPSQVLIVLALPVILLVLISAWFPKSKLVKSLRSGLATCIKYPFQLLGQGIRSLIQYIRTP